jgi:hypothetical protein
VVKGIGEQFFGKALGKLIAPGYHEVAELGRVLKLIALGQFARSVDEGVSVISMAPRANRIIILQGTPPVKNLPPFIYM